MCTNYVFVLDCTVIYAGMLPGCVNLIEVLQFATVNEELIYGKVEFQKIDMKCLLIW